VNVFHFQFHAKVGPVLGQRRFSTFVKLTIHRQDHVASIELGGFRGMGVWLHTISCIPCLLVQRTVRVFVVAVVNPITVAVSGATT